MGTLVPQAWDAGFRSPGSAFQLPPRDESPHALAIPPSQMLAAPERPRDMGRACDPGSTSGRLRLRAGHITRLEVDVLLMTEPGTQARCLVSCPEGQPFPPTGEDLSEVWLCGCLQTQRALAAALCDARWLLVSVLHLGSWLVFPCSRKDHFLQPALAQPCEWRTSRFLQRFTSAESCFALSNYTA